MDGDPPKLGDRRLGSPEFLMADDLCSPAGWADFCSELGRGCHAELQTMVGRLGEEQWPGTGHGGGKQHHHRLSWSVPLCGGFPGTALAGGRGSGGGHKGVVCVGGGDSI